MTTLMTMRNAATFVAAFYLVPAPAGAQSGAAPAATAPSPATIFASIGDRPAILYDAPSVKANRNFILVRYAPLEVLVRLDKWTKVRDADNTVGWVENAYLGERRFVQVSAGVADVRASAAPTARLVFEAQRGVLLEAVGPAAEGWLPVRHRDGQSGFVRGNQVWGG